MKARHLLSAVELSQLQEYLEATLESIGLPSQPEVVLRLLELSGNPESQIQDYAKVVRTDHAVSGRVLRLANSAFFAQRAPVSSIERACLVLGLERLKSVALGFHLSRAAMCGAEKDLARDVWGQSVMRACVSAELARLIAPSHVAEAFVIGLMIDAGIPMMPRLVGRGYDSLFNSRPTPTRLFRLEHETLPFTHVDVVAAMARKWKLPEMLLRPLELHHVRPAEPRRDDAMGRLHRVAYTVGMIELSPKTQDEPFVGAPDFTGAGKVLGLTGPEMDLVIRKSVSEYGAAVAVFSDIASNLAEGDDLVDLVHAGLIRAVDSTVLDSIAREQVATHRLVVAGQTLEATREQDGSAVVVLYDAKGQQLMTHRFPPGGASPEAVADALGLDLGGPDDTRRLAEYLRAKAA
ncbi:hypothetical protein PHYC_00287 [Phycisphaerales bacterium]|nr:hypothetical protein PHYC_00287 [Phycisphaerales bacterium]